jgi:hypothetical protein
VLHPGLPGPEERSPWLAEVVEKRKQNEEAKRRKFIEAARQDPALASKITLTAWIDAPDPNKPGASSKRACDLSATLGQLAEKSGLSIIADYDPCWYDYYASLDPGSTGPGMRKWLQSDLPEMPVWQALEQIRTYFGVEWEKRGSVLFVRSPRIPYVMMDRIDVINPPTRPNYWQVLLKTYHPGDRIPGVVYDE